MAAKILFLPSKNSPIPFTLFQIILIALSLEWSVLLLFPSIVGIDPWTHQLITLDILDKGHIVGGGYQHLPIYHVAIGITSLITGLSYKMATMLFISFLQVVCGVLFISLLGKHLPGVIIQLVNSPGTGSNWMGDNLISDENHIKRAMAKISG
ncbi:hypothetical protein ES705_36625 [subsurface metagenome]